MCRLVALRSEAGSSSPGAYPWSVGRLGYGLVGEASDNLDVDRDRVLGVPRRAEAKAVRCRHESGAPGCDQWPWRYIRRSARERGYASSFRTRLSGSVSVRVPWTPRARSRRRRQAPGTHLRTAPIFPPASVSITPLDNIYYVDLPAKPPLAGYCDHDRRQHRWSLASWSSSDNESQPGGWSAWRRRWSRGQGVGLQPRHEVVEVRWEQREVQRTKQPPPRDRAPGVEASKIQRDYGWVLVVSSSSAMGTGLPMW
jgi:hypothetical protein